MDATKLARLCAIVALFLAPAFKARALPQPIVPRAFLGYWNSAGVQGANNCYNYAVNRRTDSFAQPGQGSGVFLRRLSCAAVYGVVAKDLGLVPTRAFSPIESRETLVALVIAPDYDFHFYRRDRSGYWSHKPGKDPAKFTDDAGAFIRNPIMAARGPYTEFCGFFRVKNFLYYRHEQNGGYVRIGSMTDLPALPAGTSLPTIERLASEPRAESEIELLMYSGRPNPRIALRDALTDQKIGNLLRSWAAGQVGARPDPVPPRLGYRGILIRDPEGILLAKGIELFLKPAPGVDARGALAEFEFGDPGEGGRLERSLREFVLR